MNVQKHKTVILWLGAVVITFLTGYIYNITDENYPISGTIGVEGKKVSYMFEKTHYGPDPFTIIIRTDNPRITGLILWQPEPDKGRWLVIEMTNEEKILKGEIPFKSPLKQIKYRVSVADEKKEYQLAGGLSIPLTFFAKVPVPVKLFNGFLLYLIIFLSVRTGLEAFNTNQKIKKFSFITVSASLLFTAMIHPLYLSYKYGYINHEVPPIGNLFPVYSILILGVWILFTVFHFKVKNPKPLAAASMLITIAVYLLIRF